MADEPPSGKAYLQPSVRTQTTWTPSLLRSALASADSGNLRLVADLCDWILGDDRVRSCFESRINGLLGIDDIDFETKLPTRRRKSRQPQRRSPIVKALDGEGDADFWHVWPEDEAFQILQWARLLGVVPVNLNWPTSADQDTGRLVPSCRHWHPRGLTHDFQSRRWLVKTGTWGGDVVEIDPDSHDWLLYTPYGRFRPWAHGLWRGLSGWVLLKSFARDDWSRASETAARLVAKSAKSNKDQRKELGDSLYSMGRAGVIILPDGFDLDLIATPADTHSLYEKQIEMANNAITINIKGQNLTTEVKGGSFAAAKQHGSGENDQLESDAQSEATFLHDGPLARYAEINFGRAALAPWPVRNTEPEEDKATGAKVFVDLATAAAAFRELGRPLDYDALGERFNIPFGEPEEPPAPPPGTPPPSPAPPQQAKALLPEPALALSGFVEGQTYVDAVVDHGTKRGQAELQPGVDELLAFVDGLDSLDDARRKVMEFYRDALPPEQLADVAMKVFLLGELAGHLAVRKDAPEVAREEE
jgi:hypothetical protein